MLPFSRLVKFMTPPDWIWILGWMFEFTVTSLGDVRVMLVPDYKRMLEPWSDRGAKALISLSIAMAM